MIQTCKIHYNTIVGHCCPIVGGRAAPPLAVFLVEQVVSVSGGYGILMSTDQRSLLVSNILVIQVVCFLSWTGIFTPAFGGYGLVTIPVVTTVIARRRALDMSSIL